MGNSSMTGSGRIEYCKPDLTGRINNWKDNVRNLVNIVSTQKDYTLNSVENISNNILNYMTKWNECARKIEKYKKEIRELKEKRQRAFITLLNRIDEYNSKLALLEQNKNYEAAQTFTINEFSKRIGDTFYKNAVFYKSINVTADQYHDAVHSENIRLNNNLKPTKEDYSTDDSKLFYMTGTQETLKFVNNIIFIIYYALIIVLVFFLYSREFHVTIKIILILVLVLFPFYITKLQEHLRYVYRIILNRE
jgi:hypothetical protein